MVLTTGANLREQLLHTKYKQKMQQTQSTSHNALVNDIENRLKSEGITEASLQAILEQTLSYFRCVVGTIHFLDTDMLKLKAQTGIPTAILNQVSLIPVGKGMAGLAAARRQPVQVCNLQSDDSGVAKPGAKETKMEGAITVPILVGEDVRGTMGIAKPEPYEFSQDEITLLLQLSSLIGKHIT